MGLIDAHSPFPDDKDAIIRFAGKAKRHVNPVFLAISPKTGFNLSSYALRGLQYNDQWSKIKSLKSLINNHIAQAESCV